MSQFHTKYQQHISMAVTNITWTAQFLLGEWQQIKKGQVSWWFSLV